MKCKLCDATVIMSDDVKSTGDSRNIAVKNGEDYICVACSDALLFFSDTSDMIERKPQIEKKPEKKKVIVQKVKYTCIKCKSTYEGNKCDTCQTPNPLFSRPAKNKKKKKKKK